MTKLGTIKKLKKPDLQKDGNLNVHTIKEQISTKNNSSNH
jgi:hypothetical protein